LSMRGGFFALTWIFFLACALTACASKPSEPSDQNGYAGMYAKWDCGQLGELAGEAAGSSGDPAGGKVTINVSKQDLVEIEAASKAKGCNIDFRAFRP
jgi:hypothetical protein